MMEIYLDDVIVKRKQNVEHYRNLWGLSKILQRYHMKLNPKKCAFGVRSGKFLSFMYQ